MDRAPLPLISATLPSSTAAFSFDKPVHAPANLEIPAVSTGALRGSEFAPPSQTAPANVVTLADPSLPKVIKNGKWSPNEDRQLRDAVAFIGLGDWEALAAMVSTRNALQCKDRWTLFLAAGLNNSDLTPDEVKLMKRLLPTYVKNRKKPWAKLAQSFPNRSGSILKNAWKRYENSQKPKRAATLKEIGSTRRSSSANVNAFGIVAVGAVGAVGGGGGGYDEPTTPSMTMMMGMTMTEENGEEEGFDSRMARSVSVATIANDYNSNDNDDEDDDDEEEAHIDSTPPVQESSAGYNMVVPRQHDHHQHHHKHQQHHHHHHHHRQQHQQHHHNKEQQQQQQHHQETEEEKKIPTNSLQPLSSSPPPPPIASHSSSSRASHPNAQAHLPVTTQSSTQCSFAVPMPAAQQPPSSSSEKPLHLVMMPISPPRNATNISTLEFSSPFTSLTKQYHNLRSPLSARTSMGFGFAAHHPSTGGLGALDSSLLLSPPPRSSTAHVSSLFSPSPPIVRCDQSFSESGWEVPPRSESSTGPEYQTHGFMGSPGHLHSSVNMPDQDPNWSFSESNQHPWRI